MLRYLVLLLALTATCTLRTFAGGDTTWNNGDTVDVLAGVITSPVCLWSESDGTLHKQPYPWKEFHILHYDAEGNLLSDQATWYVEVYDQDGKKTGEKLWYGWEAPCVTFSHPSAKGEVFVTLWGTNGFGKAKGQHILTLAASSVESSVTAGLGGMIYVYKYAYRRNPGLAKAIMKAMQGEGATFPTTARKVISDLLEKQGYVID